MKHIYIFIFIFPFITACHNLSTKTYTIYNKKLETTYKNRVLKKTIDKLYLQSQADWFYIKGEQESKQGLYHRSISSFKKILIYKPQSFTVSLRIIDEYIKAGLHLQAFSEIQSLLKKYPNHIELHIKLGEIYRINKLYQKSFAEYNWVLKKNKYHLDILYKKALLYISQKKFVLARPLLITLSKKAEKNLHNIHYLLGYIGKTQNQPNKLVFHFKKAIEFNPRFIQPVLELFAFYRDKGKNHKAINTLETFQQKGGVSIALSSILFKSYYHKKNWDMTIKHLQVLLEEKPNNLLYQIQLAKLWEKKKEYSKAILAMKDIISKTPHVSAKIYIFYASLFEKQKNNQQALNILLKASKIFTKDTEILFYTGIIYDQLGETNKSIKWLKKVLSIDKNNVKTLNYLAYIYAHNNQNLKSATQMAQKALLLLPKNSYILDTLGWIYFKQGDFKKSLKYLELAYQKNTQESIIAEHLAEVYYRLNIFDKSIVLYKKAIGLEINKQRKKQLEQKLLTFLSKA